MNLIYKLLRRINWKPYHIISCVATTNPNHTKIIWGCSMDTTYFTQYNFLHHRKSPRNLLEISVGNIVPGHSRKKLLLLHPRGARFPNTTPLWGLPWCLRDTEPNFFSYQGQGQKWPELPSQKPKFKAVWGEPTQEGDKGGFSGEDTTSAGPCALPTSEQAEVDQGTNQTSHHRAL